MNNKLLMLGGLVPILAVLAIPHVYAESDAKRARDDLQNGNAFNPICDPNGIHTSDGQHTTIYCNAWNEGYTSTWNQSYQHPSQQPAQNVGPGGSGLQRIFNDLIQEPVPPKILHE